MKYFVLAGEPSGDMYGANMLRELLLLDKNADVNFVGGKNMELITGKKSLIPLKDTAFMGFVDVVKNLNKIFQNFKVVKKHLRENFYDVVILIDYPGFNLKMAKWCKKRGLKVYYYISPTVWAWKESRVHTIIKYVDKLFTIIPFETEFYKKYNYHVEYVGHPLLDMIDKKNILISRQEFIAQHHLPDKKFIAVLPGSRIQEIKSILPVMATVFDKFKDYHFLIAGISRISDELYLPYLKENVSIVYDDTYSILNFSEAGIIKSGTSTMEAALLELPQLVCYKGGWLSYLIARMLVKNIQYISMVNLIMQREVVKELIQSDFNEKKLITELKRILFDKDSIEKMKKDYWEMKSKLGGAGASKRLSEKIYYSLLQQ